MKVSYVISVLLECRLIILLSIISNKPLFHLLFGDATNEIGNLKRGKHNITHLYTCTLQPSPIRLLHGGNEPPFPNQHICRFSRCLNRNLLTRLCDLIVRNNFHSSLISAQRRKMNLYRRKEQKKIYIYICV